MRVTFGDNEIHRGAMGEIRFAGEIFGYAEDEIQQSRMKSAAKGGRM